MCAEVKSDSISHQENATLVSAFISNGNQRTDRTTKDYVLLSQHLLKCDIPKVIFIEPFIYDFYFRINDEHGMYPQTRFVFIDRDSIFLHQYRKQIIYPAGSGEKDTLDYFMIICNKTEWVRQAIELNFFETDQYVWVDFGLFHIYSDEEKFRNSLNFLVKKTYENIRIGGIWNLEITPESRHLDIYRTVAWYFCGGVFGGAKDKLILFNELVQKKCKEIIFLKHALMWEVNIWYLVYLDNKELFDFYSCGHNCSILNNY